ASVTSRALLGLKALYTSVNANRRKRARAAIGGESNSSLKEDVDRERGRDNVPRRNRRAGLRGTRTGADLCKDKSGCGMLVARVSAGSFAAMPLMGHRYRYVSTIGAGRFSDVVRAEDTFRPGRSVAVKVMNLDSGAIGIREMRLMRFLSSVSHSEFRPVVRLVDALTYRGHFCLVMELFDGSLSHLGVGGDAAQRNGSPAPATTRSGQAWPYPRTLREAGPSRLGDRIRHNQGDNHQRPGIAVELESGLGAGRWGGVRGVKASMPPSSWRAGVGSMEERDNRGSAGSSPGAGRPTHVIRHVAFQLVSALLLLHNHGLIHGDIRPENILVKIDGQQTETGHDACLEDFLTGRAGIIGTQGLRVNLGDFGNVIHKSEAHLYYRDFEFQTLAYRAPEVLMGCPLGPPVDVWSVGIVLLEMLLGRPLFHTAGSRAALLQQTVCAFGPLPLRRFRVGHYFSEYFAPDQSFKVRMANSSTSHSNEGCCSCCWARDQMSTDEETDRQLTLPSPDVPCDGRCVRRCRLASSRGTALASVHAADDRRGPGSVGSAACDGFGVAHAHLSRLIRAAGVVPPHPCDDTDAVATGSGGGFEECRHRSKAKLHAPRPKRSGFTTSQVARQDPRLLNFLARLLCYNPDERLTPLQALAHPFFGEALPFPVLQPATASIGDHQKQASAVQSTRVATASGAPNSAGTSRMFELIAPELAQHGERGGQRIPSSKGVHVPSAHSILAEFPRQKEESPSSCRKGALGNLGQSPCETAASRTIRRPKGGQDKSSKPADVAAAPTAPRKAASRFTGGSCSGVPVPTCPAEGPERSVAVDPTAQLRRLAEVAEAMMDKNNTRQGEGCGDGGRGNGSDASGTSAPPSPRSNGSLDAEFHAKPDHQESQADLVPTSHRRGTRFSSALALATPKPDLEERRDVGVTSVVTATAMTRVVTVEVGGDKETEGSALRPRDMKSATMASTPPRAGDKKSSSGDRLKQSQHEKKRVMTAIPKRAAKKVARRGAASKRATPSRRSATGDRKRATKKSEPPPTSTPSRALSGRSTTPRRAAIKAEAALLRLREEDESSDGSLTL
ncbi:unnamed protein product, partial [Scytosiphon promiscuus]